MVTTAKGIFVKNPLTIVGGIVTLIALLVTMLLVLNNTGSGLDSGQKTLLITTVIGLIANAIPSLLSLLKTEDTQHDIRNGVVKKKVKEAVEEMASDPESPANVLAYQPPSQDQEGKTDG
jgi:hypothetical protein